MGEAITNLPNQLQEESFKRDLWDPELTFSVEEANGEVDGTNVLARVKGNFFVPNGISRNNRFYPKELWEKVCTDPRIKQQFMDRRMYGTIGHNQKIDDDAIRDGKISHVIVNLSVAGEKGIGEALVLDTPAGRILNTFLRAGSKLFVSSRADGRYAGEQNGVPRVDPSRFVLETFDFVIDPGFTQANPQLVESLEQLVESLSKVNSLDNTMEKSMPQALLESLSKENGLIKNDLEKAMKEVNDLRAEKTVLMSESQNLKTQLSKAEVSVRLIEKYKAIGTHEEFTESVKRLEKYSSFFEQHGTQSQVVKAFASAKKRLLEFKRIGEPNEINKLIDRLTGLVEAYKKSGTPAEFAALCERSEKVMESFTESSNFKKIASLSKELGVSEEKIRKVYGKMPDKDLKEFFSGLKEGAPTKTVSRVSSTYKRPLNENKGNKKEERPGLDLDRPRSVRLMEHFK